MTTTEFTNVAAAACAVLSAVIAFFVGNSFIDKFMAFFAILLITNIVMFCIESFNIIIRKKYFLLLIAIILIPFLSLLFPKFRNFIAPVIPNEIIRIEYDLSSPGFNEDNRMTVQTDLGTYTLERVKRIKQDVYRIHFPARILGVEHFSTIYSAEKGPMESKTWEEDKDFIIIDDYIESLHGLNEHINEGQGTHFIVYRYRQDLQEFLKSPSSFFIKQD
ncbi:MAG: hypothetical protein ABIA77_01380 [Candidatus Omnitrophota bacterium]